MSGITTFIIRAVIIMIFFQFCGRNRGGKQTKEGTLKPAQTSVVKKNAISFDTLSVTYGDLNYDNLDDLVVVLKQDGEDTLYPAPKRLLQIFFKSKDGSFALVCSSENIVMTHSMGGTGAADPFIGAEINKGRLEIAHYGGMGSYYWQQAVRFQFSEKGKNFYLNRVEKREKKKSDNLDKTTVKTSKDFGLLPLDKYNVFGDSD